LVEYSINIGQCRVLHATWLWTKEVQTSFHLFPVVFNSDLHKVWGTGLYNLGLTWRLLYLSHFVILSKFYSSFGIYTLMYLFPLVNGIACLYQQQFYRLLIFFLFVLVRKFHSNFGVYIYVVEGISSHLPKLVQLQKLLNPI